MSDDLKRPDLQALHTYFARASDCSHMDLRTIGELLEYAGRLEAALRALVDYTESTLSHDVYGGYTHCFFCGGIKFNGQDAEHAPDCPIVLARKALGE